MSRLIINYFTTIITTAFSQRIHGSDNERNIRLMSIAALIETSQHV